ncbi:hypothetical protein, partial [Vibrio anguillarum]
QDKQQANKIIEHRINEEDIKDTQWFIDKAYALKANLEVDPSASVELLKFVSRYAIRGSSETKEILRKVGFGPEDVLRLAEMMAKDGDPQLNFLVGSFYNQGIADLNHSQRDIEAMKWFKRAANAGHDEAQN